MVVPDPSTAPVPPVMVSMLDVVSVRLPDVTVLGVVHDRLPDVSDVSICPLTVALAAGHVSVYVVVGLWALNPRYPVPVPLGSSINAMPVEVLCITMPRPVLEFVSSNPMPVLELLASMPGPVPVLL